MGKSNKVYSFTKVRKKRTQSGFIALAVGVESLVVLTFLICLGVYKAGQLSGMICFIPYISFFACLILSIKTKFDREHMDVSGKYLVIGHRVCKISAWVHAIVFLMGVYKIIM